MFLTTYPAPGRSKNGLLILKLQPHSLDHVDEWCAEKGSTIDGKRAVRGAPAGEVPHYITSIACPGLGPPLSRLNSEYIKTERVNDDVVCGLGAKPASIGGAAYPGDSLRTTEGTWMDVPKMWGRPMAFLDVGYDLDRVAAPTWKSQPLARSPAEFTGVMAELLPLEPAAVRP